MSRRWSHGPVVALNLSHVVVSVRRGAGVPLTLLTPEPKLATWRGDLHRFLCVEAQEMSYRYLSSHWRGGGYPPQFVTVDCLDQPKSNQTLPPHF